MGTQQILLIVLSVIIVGIAVAVGISMFNSQSINSARQAILSDMNQYAVQAQTYYKTPTNMGGAGYAAIVGATLNNYMGFTAAGVLQNDNAVYTASVAGTVVSFSCVPNENSLNAAAKCPELTVDVNSGLITPDPFGDPTAGA